MSVHFYGYNFGGTGVFHFFAFMHPFHKLVSDFGNFQTLCGLRSRHKHYMQMSVKDLGHPLWGSQSMLDSASVMRKGRTFLIPDANSCIDYEPHKG